jgi:hypothetical protein
VKINAKANQVCGKPKSIKRIQYLNHSEDDCALLLIKVDSKRKQRNESYFFS